MVKTESTETKPKKLPTIAIIGIGCVGLLILVSIVLGIAGKLIFSKTGGGLIGGLFKKGLEQKTGISVEQGANGEVVSFKDKNTGSEVTIGDQKIPSDFPSDFPLYAGAKPTGNISGIGDEKEKGIWLLMETPDDIAKVTAFYETELTKSKWANEEKMSFGTASSWKVLKGTLEGTVVVSTLSDKEKKGTSILITLSTVQPTETDVPAEE
jgi:hypothetical protein